MDIHRGWSSVVEHTKYTLLQNPSKPKIYTAVQGLFLPNLFNRQMSPTSAFLRKVLTLRTNKERGREEGR